MNQIVAVSKSGINVLGTAGTVPDNLNYSSDYNTLKYHISGTASIQSINNGTTTQTTEGTIAHNLGYHPFFICYINAMDATSGGSGTSIGTNTYNIIAYNASVLTITRRASAWVDDTNIYFQVRNRNGGTLNASFCYKIFRNNLQF